MSDTGDQIPEDDSPEDQGETAATGAAGGAAAAPPGTEVYRVKILYSSATELCTCPPGIEPVVGGQVVVPTKYGNELCRVIGRESDPPGGGELRSILRAATPADLSRVEETTSGANIMKRKRFTLVKVVDEKLDSLAASVLAAQREQLTILAQIDEINGLLVDLIS